MLTFWSDGFQCSDFHICACHKYTVNNEILCCGVAEGIMDEHLSPGNSVSVRNRSTMSIKAIPFLVPFPQPASRIFLKFTSSMLKMLMWWVLRIWRLSFHGSRPHVLGTGN